MLILSPTDPKASQKDYETALYLYTKSNFIVEIPEVNLGIGWLYQYCLKDKNYLEKALEHYHLAAATGNAQALFNLGVMYSQGFGVQVDQKRSAEYLKQSSDKGIVEAHYNLGVKFIFGEGIEKDPIKGFKLIKKAAKTGFLPAKYKLALLYQLGIGVAANQSKAGKWLVTAAKEGSEEAQTELARLDPFTFDPIQAEPVEQVAASDIKSLLYLSLVSMAPINSSGDIYHILSWLIERKTYKLPVPDIVLSFDTESELTGSKTDTKIQVERALNFASALNLEEYFRNPFIDRALQKYLKPVTIINLIKSFLGDFEARTLHLEKGDSSQPNPRQAKLESFFANQAEEGLEIHYTDQRALTTILCDSFKQDRQKTAALLEKGYRNRNPKIISEAQQKYGKSIHNIGNKKLLILD